MLRFALFAAALFFTVGVTYAQEVVPTDYEGTPGEMGWYPWYDETGEQLIDGVYGGPSVNEPGYPGPLDYDWYPWVGWDSHTSVTAFAFAQGVELTSFVVHTQKEVMPSVYIPARISLDARDESGLSVYTQDWYYDDGTFPDGYRYALSHQVPNVTAKSLVVTLQPTQRWVLVSEIDFYGTPIPEPATILAVLCGLGGITWRKRK